RYNGLGPLYQFRWIQAFVEMVSIHCIWPCFFPFNHFSRRGAAVSKKPAREIPQPMKPNSCAISLTSLLRSCSINSWTFIPQSYNLVPECQFIFVGKDF